MTTHEDFPPLGTESDEYMNYVIPYCPTKYINPEATHQESLAFEKFMWETERANGLFVDNYPSCPLGKTYTGGNVVIYNEVSQNGEIRVYPVSCQLPEIKDDSDHDPKSKFVSVPEPETKSVADPDSEAKSVAVHEPKAKSVAVYGPYIPPHCVSWSGNVSMAERELSWGKLYQNVQPNQYVQTMGVVRNAAPPMGVVRNAAPPTTVAFPTTPKLLLTDIPDFIQLGWLNGVPPNLLFGVLIQMLGPFAYLLHNGVIKVYLADGNPGIFYLCLPRDTRWKNMGITKQIQKIFSDAWEKYGKGEGPQLPNIKPYNTTLIRPHLLTRLTN